VIRVKSVYLLPLKKALLYIVTLLVLCPVHKSIGQPALSAATANPTLSENIKRGDLRFVSYNIENLFDTYDDSLKQDNDFLPWGMYGWNEERYNKKLKNIYKVLVNLGGWELPELIALYEIENRRVLDDLIERTPLSKYGYRVIHHDSPDARGIDVGFLYRKDHFIPLQDQAIPVTFPFDTLSKTRDILFLSGIVNKRDTLHFFLCHFPSRRGGESTSEPRRIYAAELVRKKIDSLLLDNPGSNILVAGDFNDEPADRSISEVLRARGDTNELQHGDLFNYMYALKEKGLGTYKYQAFWNMLDQVMVSAAMLNVSNKIYALPSSARIFSPDWLSQPDDMSPGNKPYHTYVGPNYLGGYSDHYPIYLDLYSRP